VRCLQRIPAANKPNHGKQQARRESSPIRLLSTTTAKKATGKKRKDFNAQKKINPWSAEYKPVEEASEDPSYKLQRRPVISLSCGEPATVMHQKINQTEARSASSRRVTACTQMDAQRMKKITDETII